MLERVMMYTNTGGIGRRILTGVTEVFYLWLTNTGQKNLFETLAL